MGANFEVRFAGYNQVQQTLGQFSSEFNVNRHGLNVVLARMEDLGGCFTARGEFSGARERGGSCAGAFAGAPGVASVSAFGRVYDLRCKWKKIAGFANEHGERLGRIPYTDLYFCALGTGLARYADALRRDPFKVIALDCDNTLWRGICGEDEAIEPDLALQEFMVKQHEAGMLLTMVSKNNEQDVLDVFERYPEMPLQASAFRGLAFELGFEGCEFAGVG